MKLKLASLIVFILMAGLAFGQQAVVIKDQDSAVTANVNADGALLVSTAASGTTGEGAVQIPAANYVVKASNGTTDVEVLAANSSASYVILAASVINADTSAGYEVRICDGACSTANYFAIPAPIAATASVAGAIQAKLAMSGTKNTKVYFKCAADCSTNVTLSITYGLIPR